MSDHDDDLEAGRRVADVLARRANWAGARGESPGALAALPDGSVDAVVCDPPYPMISRKYGEMTEPDWHAMMDAVVAECRRVLAPRGSAVFILQPNSERMGRMRPWLWEFMAKWSRAWNMVQDAWWWNPAAMPTLHASRAVGLLRCSVKACVWLGPEDCYRAQDRVLWAPSDVTTAAHRAGLSDARYVRTPSGHGKRLGRIVRAQAERGGVTPFNLIPCTNTGSGADASAAYDHGAGTPGRLAAWWVRYLCPPGGLVLDPFCGVGTVPIAAVVEGCRAVGVERGAQYVAHARARLREADRQLHLFGLLRSPAAP